MRTVVIDGKEYAYIFGLGAMMIFESLTGESMTGKSIAELSVTRTGVMHYACLRNGSKEFSFSFAEFVQFLNDRKIVDALNEALKMELTVWNQDAANIEDEDDAKGDKKKDK